jgi:hypothetical protein
MKWCGGLLKLSLLLTLLSGTVIAIVKSITQGKTKIPGKTLLFIALFLF